MCFLCFFKPLFIINIIALFVSTRFISMEIFQLYFTDVKKDFNSTLISEQLYYRFPVTSNDRREGKPHYKLFR